MTRSASGGCDAGEVPHTMAHRFAPLTAFARLEDGSLSSWRSTAGVIRLIVAFFSACIHLDRRRRRSRCRPVEVRCRDRAHRSRSDHRGGGRANLLPVGVNQLAGGLHFATRVEPCGDIGGAVTDSSLVKAASSAASRQELRGGPRSGPIGQGASGSPS